MRGDVGDSGNAAGDLAGRAGDVGDVAAHLGGGGGLLPDGEGDVRLDVVDPGDDRANAADRLDRGPNVGLDSVNLVGDLLGRLGGFLREVFDFAGDHGEPLSA